MHFSSSEWKMKLYAAGAENPSKLLKEDWEKLDEKEKQVLEERYQE
jgi:DNA-directed RNA polymerase specialized sigma subunit